MKTLLVTNFLFLISCAIAAHPGIGIVKDSKGNIYYTDLKQVWKISSEQSKTPVVKGVHTHELYIDGNDNLYGEHLWYNGESKDTWGHYVWCLKNTGELVKEINPTEGFLTNYSFARDSLGNMYWVERFATSRIMKKSKGGGITKLIEGKFGFIGWLACVKDGSLYFTEKNQLHKLSPDGQSDSYRMKTLVSNVGSKSTEFSMMGRNYDSYGIWTDAADNIYLAMIDSKKVICIGKDGKAETVIQTNSTWTICSGLFDNNGDLWVLENSATNEVRARKITNTELRSGKAVGISGLLPHLLATLLTAAAVILLFFSTKIVVKKKKQRLLHFAI